jgi:hypothetical protein
MLVVVGYIAGAYHNKHQQYNLPQQTPATYPTTTNTSNKTYHNKHQQYSIPQQAPAI